MRRRDIIVITPAGHYDPALAIAATRAGARGLLDLEFAADLSAAEAALQRLSHFTTGEFGVKLSASSDQVGSRLADELPERLAWVLLSNLGDDLPDWASKLAGRDVAILAEVTSVDEGRRAIGLGAKGLVLKGHESGGRVGGETAFILLQRWQRVAADAEELQVPVYVQGGIGPNTAAACMAGGATGVVLDSQLLLCRESPLGRADRMALEACDGSETVCLGTSLGQTFRLYHRPGTKLVEQLTAEFDRIESDVEQSQQAAQWQQAVATAVESDTTTALRLVGQDAALAKPMADQFVTVGGVIDAIVRQVRMNLRAAKRLAPLAEGAPMAERHGTRYPVLQGPMTRVSDTAEFAHAVAEGGGLPFLALALMRRKEVAKLLTESNKLLADRPWGVGILGFLPPEIRKEQVEVIRAQKPPFALIAGGRPDQARELEDEGIPTYLHVPSPGLLRMFLRDGARRFIFEGRECGGHVGPRSSFLLWESMVQVLLEHLGPNGRGEDLNIVFAGGINDGLSSAMLSALAAPLCERGVAIGALMGTAYLFTREAVAGGAIVERFQQEAISCDDTVLLETGPGHAIRCVQTPYFDTFESEKRRLKAEGKTHEEIVRALEWMNIGRLRVASKGIDRVTRESGASQLAEVAEDDQFSRGMYMIGQVSALRGEQTTIAELHAELCDGGQRRLESLPTEAEPAVCRERPSDIAIIGMSSFYPGSDSLRTYWRNILDGYDAVTEVPQSHWDADLFYDKNQQAPDKIVSKWGGFLGDIPFDPLRYGITPASMRCIEPLQLLLLECVRHGMDDAGYNRRPFPRERTCAVLGIGGGGSPMATAYGFRTCLPLFAQMPGVTGDPEQLVEESRKHLPQWTEDSFPGFLMNVAVGRVANRFNFGGKNYAIDAACASSLAALEACVRELEDGRVDFAVAMGADTVQTPYAYMAFSKTYALSPKGRCSPFDAKADGIVLSEGIGVVVLKRLADAERDGDNILAVIKGIGASSDGKDKGLTAPNAAGQLRALQRAYAQSGVSPTRVGLIEAHGTGTVVGDRTEAESLARVLDEAGAPTQSCALGSVKSMIGHSKCAAGVAGLIKTAMALSRKMLPPTRVDEPNPNVGFENTPLYLNTESRPWIHGGPEPRVAGVSAFGFGGTNFHVVLEEYQGDFVAPTPPAREDWPAELFVFRRARREQLVKALQQCHQGLSRGAKPEMAALADACWKASPSDASLPTATIVASSLDELRDRLPHVIQAVRGEEKTWQDPRGMYFAEEPQAESGKLAVLFPGQGSQYPNMLADVAMAFREVRDTMDNAERALWGRTDRPLGRYIYPATPFSDEDKQRHEQELSQTDIAQPALGAVDLGIYRLLESLGVDPDMYAGHSYGEYVALCAAGVMDETTLYRLSRLRGEVIQKATQETPGGMAAVEADAKQVAEALEGVEGITLANMNSPQQTVIAGSEDAISAAAAQLKERGLRCRTIPVACAFHSPAVAPAAKQLAAALTDSRFAPPRREVYANKTAQPYPDKPEAINEILAEHLTSPVRFQEQIEAMYAAGARVFIEAGPQGVLTGLVRQTLGDRPHLAVASDAKGRSGLIQLVQLAGQLLASGVPLDLGRLFADRVEKPFALTELERQTGKVDYPANTWLINGVRSRPINEPETWILGQKNMPSDDSTRLMSGTQNGTHPPAAAPQQPPATPTAPPAAQPAPAPAQPTTGQPAPAQPAAQNAWAPLTAAPGSDEATQVVLGFQNLMARFLDTQRSVVLGYLHGTGEVPPQDVAAAPVAAMPQVQAPAPGPVQSPIEMAAPGTNGSAAHPEVPAADATMARMNQQPPTAPSVEAEETGEEEAATEAAEAPAASMEELTAQLIELVSGRTGYPPEMLDQDLDLEADLGIDSIKRVEILGTLAESIGGTEEELAGKLELEKLTGIRTLRGIIEYLEEALFGEDGDAAPAAQDASPTVSAAASRNGHKPSANGAAHAPAASEDAGELEVQRALVRLVDAPLPTRASLLIPSGAVVITDDGRGTASELADRLADFGQQTALVRLRNDCQGALEDGVWYADLCDETAVAQLVEKITGELGAVGGFIHLLPLAAEGDDPWHMRAQRDVKSLYLMARALDTPLRAAADEGGALFLTTSALGGTLGFGEELPADYNPGHGGILGFTKCLAIEWPDVLVRAIDLDRDRSVGELVDSLVGELSDADGPNEVGYEGTRRITWEPYQAPLEGDLDAATPLDSDSTLVITGGARGITATVAMEIARRYQPHVVLMGRSPLPQDEESADTAGLTDTAELKAALMKRLEASGEKVAPAAIEAEYQRIMREREIRGNMQKIAESATSVEYLPVDVRDEETFAAALDQVTDKYGGIDAVIHGAGIIEDKLVRDKTPESFDRVFQTKVNSARVLADKLDPTRLKFCVFFASLASRYGNRGQADYAAGNEVLSKLAAQLDRTWDARVTAIAWGPWSGVGMVANLERHLVARGLKLISPEEGPTFVVEEMALGSKGQTEIIVAGGAENIAAPQGQTLAEVGQ